jgi:hypothetical protein
MGDGHTVTCTNPGVAYKPVDGGEPSPACGYLYKQASRDEPGGTFRVTATTYWRVPWSGGGESGVITAVRVSAVDLTINEAQVVVK